MAVNSYDPVDGHPIFVDSDAPDVKVDPTEAAKYAGKVGTRLIGTTSARTAYTFAREGLEWYDTDLDSVFLHTGSGWRLWERDWTSYTPTFSGFAGSVAAQYKVDRGEVTVRIRVAITSMTSNPTFSLPINASDAVLEHQPGSATLIPAAGIEYPGVVRRPGVNNSVTIYALSTSGSYVGIVNVTSAIPFAWASGAAIGLYFKYQAA